MTLLDVCEPLFQYVCRLNRLGRKGGSVDAGQVRAEIRGLLSDMRAKAEGAGQGGQFEKVRLPLIFFVDFLIRESRLPFASSWKNLAYDEKELAGDEKFFELLEETLADGSDAASQRLAVFYTCIGLGFSGVYIGQPEVLKRKNMEIAARLRGQIESGSASRICPDAYENVDTRVLTRPPGRSLVGIAVVLIGLVLVLFAVNITMYRSASSSMKRALEAIEKQAAAGVPAVPGAPGR